jgi:hypothetical protein
MKRIITHCCPCRQFDVAMKESEKEGIGVMVFLKI